MKHVPHLVVAQPWPETGKLSLSISQWRHLTKVLRKNRGDSVTYTDGLGTIGSGVLGNTEIVRGEEATVERPPDFTLAVAPPSNKDRQRFLVEKLSELGVSRLIWLKTENGKNRVSSPAKVFSWVQTALEQSRGAWLMETGHDVVPIAEIEGPLVVCHPGGSGEPEPGSTILIGPEGGFREEEIPPDATRWDLGPTILRVETAAIVAAARISAY